MGYKNPPKATRFKKGQSGNPSGRPKKTAPLREVFRRELSGPMLFKVGGKVRAFDSREAYVQELVKSARKGSIADIRIILDLERAYELATALVAEQQRQCGVARGAEDGRERRGMGTTLWRRMRRTPRRRPLDRCARAGATQLNRE